MRIGNGELRLVDDVAVSFAELVAQTASQNVNPPTTIALSGGDTARSCYEELARTDGIDWAEVELFVGDERCVPPDDEDANQRMIRRALVDKVGATFHPMDCDRPELYNELVGELGSFDLVHLGLGPDGHTASLFPGSAGLDSTPGELVVRNVDPSGHNPHERLTLTFEAISRSRLVVFTVSGASKHEALQKVIEGDDLPAARVRASEVVWLCDREALGEDT